MNFAREIPEIAPLFEGADHIDVKTALGNTSLRQFIARMLSYYPWWVVCLFRIRGVLVRILGLYKHPRPDSLPQLDSQDISFVPGEAVTFFTVRWAKDEHYWIGETPEDKHLSAYFAVIVEPMGTNQKRFHVATIVRYKHWTGPVYFNIIRPFHHLVVGHMVRAGVAQRRSAASEG